MYGQGGPTDTILIRRQYSLTNRSSAGTTTNGGGGPSSVKSEPLNAPPSCLTPTLMYAAANDERPFRLQLIPIGGPALPLTRGTTSPNREYFPSTSQQQSQ